MRSNRYYACVVCSIFVAILGSFSGKAQIYEENFGNQPDCSGAGTVADGFDPGQGVWTVTQTGTNGPAANRWYISTSAVGNGDIGSCVEDCSDGGKRTLHIGNSFGTVDQGAVYEESGNSFPFITSTRVESPFIDCSGSFNNSLTVRYAHNSLNVFDIASVFYSPDGIIWSYLQDLGNTALCPVGTNLVWDELTIPLPASANNNPNVKVGFNWVNDDLEIGSGLRPSVAIDFVKIDEGPTPDLPAPAFSVLEGSVDICEQTCITFLSETVFDPSSSGADLATYEWEFPGAVPATSAAQNPLNICYSEPGDYNVSLTVTDNIGTGLTVTQDGFITVQDCAPTIFVSIDNDTPCWGEQCVSLSSEGTLGEINPFSWQWIFTSENGLDVFFSDQANPTNICFDQIGFYDLSVSVSNVEGYTEEIELENYIEVLDCAGPEIEFTVSQEVICVGDCIQFTGTSTSENSIIEWAWTLPGGQTIGEVDPEVSSQQNPVVCYDTPGSYWAVLSATDIEGPTAMPDSILITVDPCTGPIVPDFGASDTIICAGDCVNFQNQSLGFQTTYTWIFGGINQSSTEENPQVICYDSPGTYNITLIVENGIDIPSQIVKVDFITVENCLNPPVPMFSVSQDSICVGECVDFFDQSTGLGSEFFEYEWIFEGAAAGTDTSIEENPSDVCYNDIGTFDVILKVKRFSVPDSATQIFSDVITVSDSPDCIPNSVEDDYIVSQNRLILFPNPAKKSVTINIESNTAGVYSLAICSIDGRLIHLERIHTNRLELDLTDFAEGTYILNLLDVSGNSIAHSKLIKQ